MPRLYRIFVVLCVIAALSGSATAGVVGASTHADDSGDEALLSQVDTNESIDIDDSIDDAIGDTSNATDSEPAESPRVLDTVRGEATDVVGDVGNVTSSTIDSLDPLGTVIGDVGSAVDTILSPIDRIGVGWLDTGSVGPGTATGVALVSILGIGANATAAGGTTGSMAVQPVLSSPTSRQPLVRAIRRLTAQPWEYLVSILRYSRYDNSDPLEHDRRRTLYEEIVEHPGLYLSEVEKVTDIPLSTARHHLRILEEEGLLTSETIRSKRRYFATDVAESEQQAIGLDPTKRQILELLTHESATNSALAGELDLDPSTISHHLSILEDDGLVVRESSGRSIVNRIDPGAREEFGAEPPRVNG